MSAQHEAALRYAEFGYPVFPCAPGTKTPITEHGHLDATTDPEQIERWWTQRPSANVAIATAGLVVIDADAESAWLADRLERALELAAAPLSLTANDGRQYVFRQPAGKAWRNTTSRLAPNVDTRADGGYIVAPPSVLAGGIDPRGCIVRDGRRSRRPAAADQTLGAAAEQAVNGRQRERIEVNRAEGPHVPTVRMPPLPSRLHAPDHRRTNSTPSGMPSLWKANNDFREGAGLNHQVSHHGTDQPSFVENRSPGRICDYCGDARRRVHWGRGNHAGATACGFPPDSGDRTFNLSDPHRTYEIRCPVHGFIRLNDWEREIVSQPAFQRLRRIRQLAWTDYVYPGAMHTRFEHSLGVMHTATLLYDAIVLRSKSVLASELAYNDEGLKRHRQLIRLAALLHDVGHGPFSHAAEELMPTKDDGTPFRHEQYSAAIVRTHLKDAIEDHPLNAANYDFKAEDVAALLEGSSNAKQAVFWRELIDGQMDADRMDYLLRDSLHAGVQYGRFDRDRIVGTIVAIPGADGKGPRLGVSEGGWHAAEALVLARYFMFTQVYFHKTRVAFDHHLQGALAEMLPGGTFPSPVAEELDDYMAWDDWKVLGMLAEGGGGDHGLRLATRNHFREVYHTPESPTADDLEQLSAVRNALGALVAEEAEAEKSWYKTGKTDIPVVSETRSNSVQPLSEYSSVVGNMKPIRQRLLYVRPEDDNEARTKRDHALEGGTDA